MNRQFLMKTKFSDALLKIIFFSFFSFFNFLPLQAQNNFDVGAKSSLRKLQLAEMAISRLYVDTVNEESLVENGIRGMLEKLDPHSSYTTARETKAMNESLNGSFEGIGVQFNMQEDTLIVIQTVTNGPSEKVGIQAGDRIIAVNDTAIAGVKMSKEEIMKRLRGPKGTKVRLTIIRRGIGERLTFVVTRAKIPVKTLDAWYMISPGTGYIRIGSFGATTYDEFMKAVNDLRAKGMNDLVLDLEDNGGGYLQAAVQVANEFLQRGDLIVYTEGRRFPRQDYKAQGNGKLRSGNVTVLVHRFRRRDSYRSFAGSGPCACCGTPFFWEGACTTAYRLPRREYDAAHYRPLLYSFRALHPEVL